jgi:hypothetical protein
LCRSAKGKGKQGEDREKNFFWFVFLGLFARLNGLTFLCWKPHNGLKNEIDSQGSTNY